MRYAFAIGTRYLRSRRRSSVTGITSIAVTGVALGVAAHLCVTAITAGFQQEFRNKVLGVNAHVLVLKYGLDFGEYREVIQRVRHMPEVAGAAPFEIDEMMLAHGDRLANVLVKGVDPVAMRTVLDLPEHMVAGSLDGLRLPGAMPPVRPEDLMEDHGAEDNDLDRFLEQLAHADGGLALAPLPDDVDAGAALLAPPDAGAPDDADGGAHVLSPAQMEDLLAGGGTAALPNEAQETAWVDQMNREHDLLQEARTLPGAVVGITLAQELGIGVGDRVQVMSPLAGVDTGGWGGHTGAPRSRDFRVIGVFQAGFQEYDSRLVYTDLYEAQNLADRNDTVTGVEIRLKDLDQAPQVARRIERMLGGGPYHTVDWEDLNYNLFTALAIQKTILSIVIATIIVVAAFMVIATLIMVVLERKREIAILKAMGAKDFAVMMIFVQQGTVIGVIGTALGLLVGGGLCAWLARYHFPLDPKVYLIDHLPVRLGLWEVGTTAIVALLICTTATLIPSSWAARLLPAEGVRYE